MSEHRPIFKIRSLSDGFGYVIDAVWPDGASKQLDGLYVAPRFARQWIVEKSEAWLKEHHRQGSH